MGRRSVKENKSVFQLKREELGLTREAASMGMTAVSPERLEKIENDKVQMQPYDALEMSRCYRAPELRNYYCRNVCAIGTVDVRELEEKDLPQIAVDAVSCLNRLHGRRDRLLDIAADGDLTPDEYRDFAAIRDDLEHLARMADSLRVWLEKRMARGEAAGPED